MSDEVISALIGMAGSILSALIGVGFLGKILERNFHTNFFTYTDKGHDLRKIMKKAKYNITIVVMYGVNLLETYVEDMKTYMAEKDVQIKFLLLTKDMAQRMDKRYYGIENETSARRMIIALEKLKELSQYENFEVKVWNDSLSASYIAVDVLYEKNGEIKKRFTRNSIIQVMLYQFGIHTPNAPITYVSARKNRK